MAPLPESGRRLEDCRTPKAGAIADIMHVRENVMDRGVYAASPSGDSPGCVSFSKSECRSGINAADRGGKVWAHFSVIHFSVIGVPRSGMTEI
jgi:hypothetical protein